MRGVLVYIYIFLIHGRFSFGKIDITLDDFEQHINGPNCFTRIKGDPKEAVTTFPPDEVKPDKTKIRKICDDEILVTAESGYQIKVVLTHVNIDPENGYLLIKSGTDLKDELDGRIFVHQIKRPREFISLANSVYIKLFSYVETNNNGDFSLTVSRIGEAVTNTPSTTTERWPTPPPEEPGYLVVNITVPKDIPDNKLGYSFTEVVAEMATNYCNDNNITLQEDLRSDDVRLISIIHCPLNWPKRDTCRQVNFSVPIRFSEQEEGIITAYELTSRSLAYMWGNFSNEALPDHGLSNYDDPGTNFVLWLTIICSTILLFSVILYFIKQMGYKLSGFNMNHKPLNNEASEEMSSKSQKKNQLSPHIRQIFPPIFESERQYYEP